MLALKKLAGEQVVPTREEIQQAYESEYGTSVRARILVVDNETKARQLHAQLMAQPHEFVRLTRQHSIDINSASNGGLIQPIRRHVGDPNIEQAAFSMQPGEISRILKVGDQYVILKCEGRLPARDVPVEKVKPMLAEHIRQGKLREESVRVFQNLQKHAQVENTYNNPQRQPSTPGVVATINGEPVAMRELAEECLAVYGEPVLENEINKLLLHQEMERRKLQTTQAELDAEVAHAAQLAGVVDAQGKPDIARWMQLVTQEEGATRETYYSDVVWPSVALKKLTHGKVEVTEEDLRKGFEANYGPRVRCRVIVMKNQRRAEEVWDKARKNPTAEYFGKLAEEYSLDAGSRQRGGEVPPLKRYGGHELLENQAFALQPGEISGVIQVGQQNVILFCEGYTKPVKVEFAEVRDLIYRDLFEKKLRIAMNNEFVDVQERAQIDNFLAGTSQSPKGPDPTGTAAGRTDTAVRPASATSRTRG